MRDLYDLIMRRLIPHIVEFFAGLLNPSKPGPTLERISVLGNIIMAVMLFYVVKTGVEKQEHWAQTAGKSDGYVVMIDNLKEQVTDYRSQLQLANQKLSDKELRLEQCLLDQPEHSSGPSTKGHRELVDDVNKMR